MKVYIFRRKKFYLFETARRIDFKNLYFGNRILIFYISIVRYVAILKDRFSKDIIYSFRILTLFYR